MRRMKFCVCLVSLLLIEASNVMGNALLTCASAPVLTDTNAVSDWNLAWDMAKSKLTCTSEFGVRRLHNWLRLDSGGYDSGVWISLYVTGGRYDFCQSNSRWNVKSYALKDSADHDWGAYFAYSQPWFSDQSPCADTAFGYPPDQPRYDLLSWPKNSAPLPVRGLMVFELLAGSDTVYNYVPFQLNYWNAPIQPDGVRSRGQVSRSAPVRQGDGWLLPAEAAGPVTAWDARGHRLALRQETTAEGVRVQLPPGRGLAFLRAGIQRWSVLR